MAIGERIKFIRNLRSMTQKHLGMSIGFCENTADVRIAQYESGTRTPKANITQLLATALDVIPQALNIPDIDSRIGLAHTLFALEDIYGFHIERNGDALCLKLDQSENASSAAMLSILLAWQKQSEKLHSGEITKREYDQWRYKFSEIENT